MTRTEMDRRLGLLEEEIAATKLLLKWCPACHAGAYTPLTTCEDCGATLVLQGR